MEIETDETDVKWSQDSHSIPDVPVELTPINCPNDCLVVYPVMPGKNFLFSFMQTPKCRYKVMFMKTPKWIGKVVFMKTPKWIGKVVFIKTTTCRYGLVKWCL